jgi:hypothetical protein
MKIIEYRPFASNVRKPFAFGPKLSDFLPLCVPKTSSECDTALESPKLAG